MKMKDLLHLFDIIDSILKLAFKKKGTDCSF